MKQRFTIMGEPTAKERPRFSGKNKKVYTPRKTLDYENKVALSYKKMGYIPFSEKLPLKMTIETYHAIPKSTSQKNRLLMLEQKLLPTKKPDADNLIKAVADSLNGVAYHDDSQIVSVSLHKFYGDTPRVLVCLENFKEAKTNDRT